MGGYQSFEGKYRLHVQEGCMEMIHSSETLATGTQDPEERDDFYSRGNFRSQLISILS